MSTLGTMTQALTDVAVLTLASDDSRAVLTLDRKHFVHCAGRVKGAPSVEFGSLRSDRDYGLLLTFPPPDLQATNEVGCCAPSDSHMLALRPEGEAA